MECLVSFTPRHLYPQGKKSQYQLNRTPGPPERFVLLSCTDYDSYSDDGLTEWLLKGFVNIISRKII